jgi:hypothetical protein
MPNRIPVKKRQIKPGAHVFFLAACVGGLLIAFPSKAQGDELFRDLPLNHGFTLSAVRSSMRPNELGPVMATTSNQAASSPQWRFAQWGSRFGLKTTSPVTRDGAVRAMSNQGKTIRILPGGLSGQGVTMVVKGAAEYDNQLRQKGEAWPHTLIEQKLRDLKLAGRDRLQLQLEFRIARCENNTGLTLARNLHTAQITAFFAIHNRNKDSADFNDMIWFGIPLFDARVPVPGGHQAVDGGKNDATGKFICTLKGSRFWQNPTGDGQWHKLDVNLIPLIKEALAALQAKGFLTDTKFDDLQASSFVRGWEVPGPYDCSATIRKLSLMGR